MAEPTGPLAGMVVLDIATFIAAPYCATILAEFGAEVIKVEMPKTGDPTRKFGSMTECGDSLNFLSEARNKRSVTLDLRMAEGAELLRQLVARADVLCENFQTGTLEKWGLGWDVLAAINPKLVMLRVTGYGQTGPYAGRPGFGRIANGFGGISFLAGEPDGPPVTPGSATLADYMAGLFGAFGVMVALRERETSGLGQMVDMALYESVFRILDELAPAYDRFGFVRQRMGAGTVNAVPHAHYPTRDDRWVAIACTNDKIFARLADLMGRADLAGDGPLGTIARREARRFEVDGMVADWTRTMDRAEILALCETGQVPCGPIYSIDEIFADPQFAARGNILRIDDPRAGKLAIANAVPRLTRTPAKVRTLGPALGADNTAILGGWLGLDATKLADLAARGVI